MKFGREDRALGLRFRGGALAGLAGLAGLACFAAVGLLVAVGLLLLGGCSGSDDDALPTATTSGPGGTSGSSGASATLPWTAPTKSQVATAAGLDLPDSVEAWRSVLMSPGELDVSFTISRDDVAAFDEGSKLGLKPGERVVAHASPLWDLNVEGTYAGATGERGPIRRTVEVVSPTDPAAPAQVRLVVTAIP